MKLRYVSHFHGPRIPQFRVMWDSILQFDRDSKMTAVVDTLETAEACADMRGVEFVHWEEMASDCCGVLPFMKCQSRGPRLFSWTYQACLPWWVMRRSKEKNFVYVDSDCMFFSSLVPYIEAIPQSAFVGICPHFFPEGKENEGAGRFNNGICWWRKTPESIEHARKWGIWSIEVFDPHEQKVLETWPDELGDKCYQFPGAVNWGPWRRSEGRGVQSAHFHEMRMGSGPNETLINGEFWSRSGYDLEPEAVDNLYFKYEAELRKYA